VKLVLGKHVGRVIVVTVPSLSAYTPSIITLLSLIGWISHNVAPSINY